MQARDNNRPLDNVESPENALSRLFSLQSVVSTTTSFSVYHQAQEDVEVPYDRIGFGQEGAL